MRTNAKVYVMRAENGTLKLGHSRCPERRAKQVGRGVAVVHETDVVEHAERIERLAHRVLALDGTHLRGEWFEATLDQAITAIEIATRQAERQEFELGGKLKSARPPLPNGPMTQIALGLPDEVLDHADKVVAARQGQTGRTAVLREMLVGLVRANRGSVKA